MDTVNLDYRCVPPMKSAATDQVTSRKIGPNHTPLPERKMLKNMIETNDCHGVMMY